MAVLPTGIGPVTGYNIERSLRFNSADSAGLNRTAGTQTSNSAWTYSVWLKRGLISNAANLYVMRAQNPGNTLSTELFFAATNDTLVFREYGPSAYTSYLQTTQVFRDPSAWYHIVLAYNPANSTSSDKVRLYVNGVRITTFSTATYPSSTSQATAWNTSGNPQYIGSTNTNTFDGYMTEINFIDGQGNLTQNDFGETDSATGVWKPKKYGGTYGNNGFYLPFKTASQWSGYFDGSVDYLSVAHNSSLSPTGDFTIEFWAYTGSTALQEWVTKGYGIQIYSNASNWYAALSSSNNTTYFINGSFGAHSTNTWQHIAISRQGNTYRGFVNGVATTLGTSSSTPSTGTDSLFVGAIGVGGTPYYVTGYLSNLRIVNGTAVYTGTFTPPTSQLTAITNTSLLTCQSSTFVDNSTNAFTITVTGDARPQQFSPFTLDVTDDHSGTGNHWIPNNLDLRTTGVGADILVDSPTSYGSDTGVGGTVRGNYATLNPLYPSGGTRTFANGNLEVTGGALNANSTELANWQLRTGKWYFEGTVGAIGLASITQIGTSVATYYGNGTFFPSGSGASYTTNDVIGVAADIDAGTVQFYKNGVSQGTVTGTAGTASFPAFALGGNTTPPKWIVNFGQRAFAYTAPSGFKALCTQNLPPVDIGATSTTQANDYFDITLWTGDGGSSRTITNSGNFQPDLIWVKDRVTAQNHAITDRVRGAGYLLFSDATNANYTPTTYGQVTAFNSNGFTASKGSDPNFSYFNKLSNTYVGWQWKANGAGSSNTNGSVTSTVSVNTTSKFSIVTFTDPNNASNYTVGHGLGAIPSMIIHKETGTTGNWIVWHSAVMSATNQYLLLNSTAGTATLTDMWGAAVPTANVFGLKSGTSVSGGDTVVAYCFAPVAGYSAFGSYTGNGSADGVFVYTGFRPRWIMYKNSGATGSWGIVDTVRSPYNPDFPLINANSANAEAAVATFLDVTANGFKFRTSGTDFNGSSNTYIYAAFAEHPFKYSLAR